MAPYGAAIRVFRPLKTVNSKLKTPPRLPFPRRGERIAAPNPSITGTRAGDTPKTPFRGGKVDCGKAVLR
jgi:hypothetical protein